MHEQSRPDRDNYVTSSMENIEAGKGANSTRRSTVVIFGPYDFGSLMHYAQGEFAKPTARTRWCRRPGTTVRASKMGKATAPAAATSACRACIGLPPCVYRGLLLYLNVFPITAVKLSRR